MKPGYLPSDDDEQYCVEFVDIHTGEFLKHQPVRERYLDTYRVNQNLKIIKISKMGYNDNYNNGGGNYQRYQQRGSGNSYGAPYRQGSSGYSQAGGAAYGRGGKKHSGAKMGINQKGSQKGEPHIVAWNFSRSRGLISLIATKYSGTKTHESKSGRKWQNWMVSWRNTRTMQSGTTSGLFDPSSNKLIIQEFGWVCNPKARNGGYCGTFKNNGR